jgi:hypothetical protein
MWKENGCGVEGGTLIGDIKETYNTVGGKKLKEIEHLKDQELNGLAILKLFIKTQGKCKVCACNSG